jgi:hypothetical protein
MSHTTTWMCDRCKESSNDRKALALETIGIRWNQYQSASQSLIHQAEWCVKCRVEMGVVGPSHDPNAQPIAPPPTLEDVIRELIKEEIDNAK